MSHSSNMYAEAKTWNPFKGCLFRCVYCDPSFQRQSKRQKQRCMECYRYVPHYHKERLDRIPSAKIIFVAGNADISFCRPQFVREIIKAIERHNRRCPYKTYYFQSKRPEYFEQFLAEFPNNVVLLTTLETNRDAGYEVVSKAPKPSERFAQFKRLDYSRKVVTIEPVMAFDPGTFPQWIIDIGPEYVWLGLNSRPESVSLHEPSEADLRVLVERLREAGITIRMKNLREMKLVGMEFPTSQKASAKWVANGVRSISAQSVSGKRCSSTSPKAILSWTEDLASSWAEKAKPHTLQAIGLLAASSEPMSTRDLNEAVAADSGGPIIGGLQAWATRMGLPSPLMKQKIGGVVVYSFVDDRVRGFFAKAAEGNF